MRPLYKGLIGAGLAVLGSAGAYHSKQEYKRLEQLSNAPIVQEYRESKRRVLAIKSELSRPITLQDLVMQEESKERCDNLVKELETKEARLIEIYPRAKETAPGRGILTLNAIETSASYATGLGGAIMLIYGLAGCVGRAQSEVQPKK